MRTVLPAFAIVATALTAVAPALALDQIQTGRGTLSGTIRDMNPREVSLERTGGKTEPVAVNEILFIRFDGEPAQMNLVRSAAVNGRYEDALRDLDKIEADGAKIDRPELQQDLEFYRAYAAAQMALAGAAELGKAGGQMRDFAQKYPDNYHFYETSQVLGDILVALGKPDDALTYYAKLAEAPWPDYKMRAAVARGRTLAAQNKFAEAEAEFAAAASIAGSASGPLVEAQKASATLGLAECQAENGKTDEAIKLVEDIIISADPEAAELHARAYNTLGRCYTSAKRDKDALMASLRVDLLYYTVPQAHAEALHHLAGLWEAVGKPENALAARETLQQRYANSPWNK